MRKNYPVLLAFLALLLSSCSGIEKINDALEFKKAISDKYEVEKVEVKITNKENITISLNDSDLAELNHKEKQEIAAELGRMAVEMQPEGFTTGSVNFVETEDYLIASSSKTEVFDMFPDK